MSTANNSNIPDKFGVKECVILGLILCGVVQLKVWETDKPRPVHRSASHTPSPYSTYAKPVSFPTDPTRPAVDTDGTLARLNEQYARLSRRRAALDLTSRDAIVAFNEEASSYQAAVREFRALRGEQLTALNGDRFLLSNPPALNSPSYTAGSSATYQYSERVGSFSEPLTNDHYAPGYTRSDGTNVSGHYRTNPDHTIENNYSTKGNVNPYTGRPGTVRY